MNLKEIKDAARRAFRDQQTQDTEGGIPDIVSFCAGFLAGARHLEVELDELTSILDLKKETIVEMQNAYETLEAHDEMLIDTVDKLKDENRKLVEALKFYENCSSLMLKQRDLPIDHILGRSVLTERHVQDNGDVARQVLKEIGEE